MSIRFQGSDLFYAMSNSKQLKAAVILRQRAVVENKSKKFGSWAVLYGPDKNGVQMAFRLRLDVNLSNFPPRLVENGALPNVDERMDWQANDVVDYYDGGKVATATFFRHCTAEEEIQEAINDCSAMLHVDGENEEKEDGQDNSIVDVDCDRFLDRSDSYTEHRNIGSCPLSTPTARTIGSRKHLSSTFDPDYIPTTTQHKRKGIDSGDSFIEDQTTVAKHQKITDASDENSNVSLATVISLLKSIRSTVETKFNVLETKVDTLSNRVGRLEKRIDKHEFGKLDLSSTVSNATNSGDLLMRFGQEFFRNDEFDFMWMGLNLLPQLNQFLHSLNVGINKPQDAVRALVRQFWGSRGLRYWLLTDSDPNERFARPRLSEKDAVGVRIYKYVAKKVVTEMNISAAKKIKPLTDVEEAEMRKAQMESLATSSSVLEIGAQTGRDTHKVKFRQRRSWYWERLEMNQSKPNDKWSIWDECVIKEIEDMKKDDIPKEKDEQSFMLWRVRELQHQLNTAMSQAMVEELKDKYDVFGNAKV